MAEDEAREGQAERISATPADDDPKLEQDFARAPGLSRGERKVVQRLADVLRFNDFMTVMMVIATALSAFATWRTARSPICFSRSRSVPISAWTAWRLILSMPSSRAW